MPNGLFTLKQVNAGLRQGAWTGTQKTTWVEYLVVAGGGGGASEGGGGAGGLLAGLAGVSVGSAITVTVGAGGAAATAGVNSVFGNITANGGGNARNNNTAIDGGSGGGGATSSPTGSGGQGVVGQGNAGGGGANNIFNAAGGGGGAGTVGLSSSTGPTGGNGGAGIASSISGTVTTYAGGGGGSASGGTYGAGGVGGGGAAGAANAGTAGTANTGGGGGGTWGATAAAGGSGIVVLSYPDIYNSASSITGSPAVSTSGSGSALFSGGSSQSASYVTPAIGTGNFTTECWFNNSSLSNQPIFSIGTYITGIDVRLAESAANRLDIYFYNVNKYATFTSTNAWQHFAIVRNSGTTTVYLNGAVFIAGFADTNNYIGSVRVGSYQAGGAILNSFNGTISNYRLTNTAVYTTTFTPSTAPLTSVSGTQLLLNTVSPSVFNDSSSNNYTPTLVSTPAWNQLSPFATGLGYKNRVYTWTASGTITI